MLAYGWMDSVIVYGCSEWRNQKSEWNRNRNFFPIPKFFDTESDTFFDTKIFAIPNPIPNFFDTESDTIQKIGKVLKPRSFEIKMSHSGADICLFAEFWLALEREVAWFLLILCQSYTSSHILKSIQVATCVKILNLNIVGPSLIELHFWEQVLGLDQLKKLVQIFWPRV